ncbi:hypothetical protein LCGC14_2441950 [marine sediment metagenome]|uniref:DNA methylase N-4/N-6 domain-containing protein n=1 Tax=marine sediment metagenome TaxID=412755 RepID=A0A0F9ECQ8_9ZZZZ
MDWPDDYVGKIIQGDCLEVMQGMPDGCVDLVWTDPPYNVGKDYGDWNDSLPDDEYLEFCKSWTKEMKRLSSNRMVIFIPQKYKLQWWNLLGLDYREIILSWSPEGAYRGHLIKQFSTIMTNIKPVQHTKNVWHNYQMSGLGYFFRECNYNHPGYTSEDITKRVLNAFSEAGQVILDPFSGTGTTPAMCVQLARNYIAIEQGQKWCDLAHKRVERAKEQPDLFRKPAEEKQNSLNLEAK